MLGRQNIDIGVYRQRVAARRLDGTDFMDVQLLIGKPLSGGIQLADDFVDVLCGSRFYLALIGYWSSART